MVAGIVVIVGLVAAVAAFVLLQRWRMPSHSAGSAGSDPAQAQP